MPLVGSGNPRLTDDIMKALNAILSNQQGLIADVAVLKADNVRLREDIGLLKKQVAQQRMASPPTTKAVRLYSEDG